MEFLSLNNGTKAPLVGIGTFLMQPEDAEEAVYNALTNGYRLVDTANAYMNERAVGRGLKRSGVKREDVYLVTKLWPSVYADADSAIDATLKRLDTDYIDLLFLHQPAGDYVGA
ncbi:MAG: aldo/keto reductase, partial [Oscillibacter sp.]|nr:aldo/keto reductase [Oscillibacter sp.]